MTLSSGEIKGFDTKKNEQIMRDFRVIDDWTDGVGWLANPKETMQRASHAINGDAGLWLVDPLDAPGLEEWLLERGPVNGVVITLDRHKRDAQALADRFDVPIHLPDPLLEIREALGTSTDSFDRFQRDTGWAARPVVTRRWWREVALIGPEESVIYVPEAVGTAAQFRAPGERLGVHPLLRPLPPRKALGDLDPERIRVGHGTGIGVDGAAALTDALAGARKRAPRAYLNGLRSAF